MLTYDLNQRGTRPLYLYLYDCIRDDIFSGNIPSNTKLPSKRMLARHLGVGVITVANAYELLCVEGYIRGAERQGYFVNDLTGFRPPPPASKPELQEQELEVCPDDIIDFKANRASRALFPHSVWNRYMREALSFSNDMLLRTVPHCGMLELRRAIADYLVHQKGMQVSPAQIIIGAGTEYLYSRLLHLLGRNAVLALENPGYQKFAAIAGSYGNRCVYVPIDDHGLKASALAETDASVVHVSPSNHFPTGIIMPITRRLELLQWAAAAPDRYIIEDDYDSEFRYVGWHIPPLYAEDVCQRVIYINTFSKTLVPSIRISYMVLPPELMNRYHNTMSFYSCTVSSFEQYTLARFIENGHFEQHINKLRKHYKEQYTRTIDAFSHSALAPIISIQEHNAGTHFLLAIHTKLPDAEVKKKGREQGLILQLFADYWADDPPPKMPACVLVINCAGIGKSQLPEVIQKLENIFSEDIQTAQKG